MTRYLPLFLLFVLGCGGYTPPAPNPAPAPNPTPTTRPPAPQPNPQPEPDHIPPSDLAGYPKAVIDQVNTFRQKNRLSSLVSDPSLSAMAMSYAKAMATYGKLTHELNGQDLGTRLNAAHVRYSAAGENIAMGQKDPTAVVTAWQYSPPHRQNMLGRKYTLTGVGVAQDQLHRLWWAQVFTAPLLSGARPHDLEKELYTPPGLFAEE